MMVIRALVLCFPALGLFPQDKPPEAPPSKWKVNFAQTIVEKDKQWIFHIDGVTNIPAEVVLRARIYALEIVGDFVQGQREDEEPLVWEDDGGQPAFHIFHAENGGQLHEDVFKFARRPWSIKYRAKVHYFPKDQTDKTLLLMGDEELEWKADLRFGDDAAYASELIARVNEVAADLITIEKLYGEFCERYPKFLEKFDKAAWEKWKDPWLERIEEIEKRNATRYSLWAVWMERQAKMRVGGMCELLARRMIGASEAHFLEDQKTQERVQELIKGFHDYFEEAIEVIGVNAPLDPRTVGPLIKGYEKALEPLRAWIAQPKGEVDAVLRPVRRNALGSLIEIAPLLQNRKRGYLYVNAVSVRFTKLLELIDSHPSPEALKQGLEEHDAALAEFKKFAGLP